MLLIPLMGTGDMRFIISLALVAVASAIQNHLAVLDADRVAKVHDVLAILCRCGKKKKSFLPTALRTTLLSSALEALQRQGALTEFPSRSPGDSFKPLLAEVFGMRTPEVLSNERFEAAAWTQALAVRDPLIDEVERGAGRFKIEPLQAAVDAVTADGASNHIICKILNASKPYTVVEPRRIPDVLRDLEVEDHDVTMARSAFDKLANDVAWVAVYVGDEVRLGVEIKFRTAKPSTRHVRLTG
jgi:hypothetical protein